MNTWVALSVKILQTCANGANSDHPVHALSIIRAFAHSVVSNDSVSGQ